MCLAIPGRVVEFMPENSGALALVEVSGVKRQVNVDLLREEGLSAGDWVLIHVGFAMSKISSEAAEEQMRMLQMLGEDLEAMDELVGYQFGQSEGDPAS
jgi:hydrogenase expression/formation protein HypC